MGEGHVKSDDTLEYYPRTNKVFVRKENKSILKNSSKVYANPASRSTEAILRRFLTIRLGSL